MNNYHPEMRSPRVNTFQDNHRHRYRNSTDRIREQLYYDWYGPDIAIAEIASSQPSVKTVTQVLDDVMIFLDKDDNALLRTIVDKWEEIVSPDIRYNASPRRIINNTLLIEVHNASWRYHLEMNFKLEIQRLIQEISKNRIKTIRFITGGKTRRR